MAYKAPYNPAFCYLSDIISYAFPCILSIPTAGLLAVPQILQPSPTSWPGSLISYKAFTKI